MSMTLQSRSAALLPLLLSLVACEQSPSVSIGDAGTNLDAGSTLDAGPTPDAMTVDVGSVVPPPEPIRPGIYALDGQEFDLPLRDLAPLGTLVGDADIVGLGEVVHSSGGLYELKARAVRYLVSELGFRFIALESNWAASEPLADYVQTCEGTLSDLMLNRTLERAYATTELEELIQWMCEWNQMHPDDRVQFSGFDVREPWSDSTKLRGVLQTAGTETEAIRSGLLRCIAKDASTESEYHALFSGGPIPHTPKDHSACIDALDEVDTWLESAGLEEEQTALVRLFAVGLRAVEGQVYYWPGNIDGAQGASYVASIEARATGLADRLDQLIRLRHEGQRTVVWAANIHVQYELQDAMGGFVGVGAFEMGAHLRSRHGLSYRAIATLAHDLWVAPPGESERPHGVPLATDSLEQLLVELGETHLFVDLAAQDLIDPSVRSELGYLWQVPISQYDGVLFLETSRGAQALR